MNAVSLKREHPFDIPLGPEEHFHIHPTAGHGDALTNLTQNPGKRAKVASIFDGEFQYERAFGDPSASGTIYDDELDASIVSLHGYTCINGETPLTTSTTIGSVVALDWTTNQYRHASITPNSTGSTAKFGSALTYSDNENQALVTVQFEQLVGTNKDLWPGVIMSCEQTDHTETSPNPRMTLVVAVQHPVLTQIDGDRVTPKQDLYWSVK